MKYDFYSHCGGVYLLTATVDNPQRYAELLASERGLPADEIVFEQAEGTVDDFDKFFPSPMTPGEKHRLEQIPKPQILRN